MNRDENDIALVRRVKNGDKQAFNLLVEKYQFRIKRLVGRFIKDSSEQDDIVQESFFKTYRAIARFRGDSAFYTWLYRIAVNTAKNYLVARSRRPPAEDVIVDEMLYYSDGERLVEFNSPEKIMQSDQLMETITHSISNLPAELKEAIQLREFDGLSYEDIATVMNCPIGTVRSRIFRAREAISHAIADLI